MIDNNNGDRIGEPSEKRMTRQELVQRGVDAITSEGARGVGVSSAAGGLTFNTALEVMEFAKMMAVAGGAVPGHCRGNPGVCLAITMRAVEWRMSPFAVAEKSYLVKDRIGWESQLVHAVIESRAPITTRLQHRYEGEGDSRKCFVWATFVGEDESRVWPPEDEGAADQYTLAKLRPPKRAENRQRDADDDNDYKGSPLWQKKPDLQLFYNVSRDWARVYCPDVLLGVYTREEIAESPNMGREVDLAEVGAERGQELLERVAARNGGDEGYKDGHVDSELAQVAANSAGATAAEPDPAQKQAPAASGARPEAGARKASAGKGAARSPSKAAESPKAKAPEPGRATSLERGKPATKRQASAAADRAQTRASATAASAAAPKDASALKTPADYTGYARAWIDAAEDHDTAYRQWDEEREMRDRLKVPIADRRALEDRIANRFGA